MLAAPTPNGPTSESLTLSASLFHADVDSWLPAGFGVDKPEPEKNSEWEAALRSSADRSQRLGLGHAALEDAALGAKFKNQRAGIDILASKLKRKAAEDAKANRLGATKSVDEDDDEEVESRTKSIKTSKKRNDPFAKPAKAQQAKVHPALLKGKQKEKDHPALLKGKQQNEAHSTLSSNLGKRTRDDESDGGDEKEETERVEEKEGGPVLSKAERKKEKKRKQKLRKAAEAEAEKAKAPA